VRLNLKKRDQMHCLLKVECNYYNFFSLLIIYKDFNHTNHYLLFEIKWFDEINFFSISLLNVLQRIYKNKEIIKPINAKKNDSNIIYETKLKRIKINKLLSNNM
jgi:hypothetical protein